MDDIYLLLQDRIGVADYELSLFEHYYCQSIFYSLYSEHL
jgi:hypothetical protein